MKTPELMARETLKNSSLEKLLDLWELTDKMNGPQVPTVRGWLMDEIERRNLDGFRMWKDIEAGSDTSKRKLDDLFRAEDVFSSNRPTPVIWE